MALTACDVYLRLDAILKQQYQDGERRQRDEATLWGGTGGDVKRAVSYAQDIVRQPETHEIALDYIRKTISDIEKQRLDYCQNEADVDGYGNGTFKEILRAAKSIEANCLRQRNASLTSDERLPEVKMTKEKRTFTPGLSGKTSALLTLTVFALVILILTQRRF